MPTLIEECPACNSTGIYAGFGERDGAGVVCRKCGGTGYVLHSYTEFCGKIKRNDIKRVYQINPGILIGEGGEYKLEDFGGIPYEQWWANGFPKGSEMREFCCPKWWCQLVGGCDSTFEWCEVLPGQRFDSCPRLKDKEECWEKYDKDSV